jgi:Arc-like DNA binding domain
MIPPVRLAGEVYRFLLRMPQHLREQLTAASKEAGRSLNAELVHRLERTLEEDRRAASRRILRLRKGERMKRGTKQSNPRRARRRRLALGVAAVLVLVSTSLIAGAMRDSAGQTAPSAAEVEGELSPALRTKLARFSPAEPRREAGEGMGDGALEWIMHAYPRADIPLAAITESRADWKALKSRGDRHGGGRADDGALTSLGPDNAVYPLVGPRDRYVYVPNEYVAAGRTSHSLLDPSCTPSRCRYWIANAGGGIWRTDNILAPQPEWEYVSEEFAHNNTAALELDPNDSTNQTIYAGTGEPNICRSGCIAGVGMYKSTNGGDAWNGPIGAASFSGRGIGSIQVKPGDPNTIFVATGAHGSRGLSSTCCTGVDRGLNIPGAPHFGLWRSTDGGNSFTLVNQGNTTNCTSSTPPQVFLGQTACSVRGARRVMFDPVDPTIVYASFFGKGIWRSSSNGDAGTWTQILAPQGVVADPASGAGVERAEFDVVTLANGDTRMYVGVGGGVNPATGGAIPARFFRSDSVRTGTPTFTNLTNATSTAFCDPQCNYDAYVHVPRKADGSAHDPNTVYLLGDNDYDQAFFGSSNGRAVLLSTDAGASFTDMTYDATDNAHPNGIHPDQHSIVTNPADWKQFIETGDGGVIRSNGVFVDDSADCPAIVRPSSNPDTTAARLALCRAVTSRIPQRLESLNKGLNTLHFYQVTFNPNRPGELAGGTQDNGSWMRVPGTSTWIETFVADGAFNGFDAKDANYSVFSWQGGSIGVLDEPRNQRAGTWVSDTLLVLGCNTATPPVCTPAGGFPYPRELAAFIAPTLFHPTVSKMMFTGREHVFRSLNGGINPAFPRADVEEHCNVWTGDGDINEDGTYVPPVDVCDDWKAMGNPGHPGRLTYGPAAACPADLNNPSQPWNRPCPGPYPWGEDRSGGHISFIQPARSNKNVVWSATSNGRIFITTNAREANPAAIEWNRIDPTSSVDPQRYPTDIYVDASNPFHAYISYSGYNAVTPDTPGHIFEVRYNRGTGVATFRRLDGTGAGALGDLPVGTIEVDERRDVLYAGTDFGLVKMQLRSSSGGVEAVPGIPTTTIPFLALDRKNRVMYVTTHGFGAWKLGLS